MATNIKDTVIATTYKFLLKRDSGTYSQTGMNVELQNDSGVALATGLYLESGATTDFVGIGVADPDATLEILDTTVQLKLSYDGSNYSSFTTGSAGGCTHITNAEHSGMIFTRGGYSYISNGGDTTNTFWGLQSGQLAHDGGSHTNNTFYGYQSGLYLNSGASLGNTGVGSGALLSVGSGGAATYNTGIGHSAGAALTTGDDNIAIGYQCMATVTGTINHNTCVGNGAGYTLDSDRNTLIGYRSGYTMAVATDNTLVGYYCGNGLNGGVALTTGTLNILIGSETDCSAADVSNEIVLGHRAEGLGSGFVVLGNSECNRVYAGDDQGGVYYGGASAVVTSDYRIKENIEACELGLNFIDKLKPITYKKRQPKDYDDSLKATLPWHREGKKLRVLDDEQKNKFRFGFIAQDVEKELLDMNIDINNDIVENDSVTGQYGLSYSNIIIPLVKAIQELSAKVTALENA